MQELLSNLLNSIGDFEVVYTLVDFYQYIKGVEYLICVAFFIIFVKFYKYIHQPAEDANQDH